MCFYKVVNISVVECYVPERNSLLCESNGNRIVITTYDELHDLVHDGNTHLDIVCVGESLARNGYVYDEGDAKFGLLLDGNLKTHYNDTYNRLRLQILEECRKGKLKKLLCV